MLIYPLAVKSCSIALILIPSIFRLLFMKPLHVFIAVRFCKYTCSSYRCVNCIALYHTLMDNAKVWRKDMPVNEQEIRPGM